jgi:hypothetical protein
MTDRPRLDQLTDDMLDALYAELDALKAIPTGYCPDFGRGDCSPTADQWLEQRQRADRAEAERDALIDERAKLSEQLTTMTDVARSNRRHVQTIVPELEKTEAAIARVRAVLGHWEGSDISYSNFATQIRAALDTTA